MKRGTLANVNEFLRPTDVIDRQYPALVAAAHAAVVGRMEA